MLMQIQVKGKATLESPPNTGPFDPHLPRRASLHLSTPVGSQPSTGVDLAQITSFLHAVARIV